MQFIAVSPFIVADHAKLRLADAAITLEYVPYSYANKK